MEAQFRKRVSVGLMVDWLEDEYQTQVFKGIDARARELDVNLICLCGGLLEAPFRFGRERNFVYELIKGSTLDAVIVMSGAIANHVGPERLAEYCRRFSPLPMCSIGIPLPGIPSVLVDNASGVREAVARLIRVRGARRIGFIRGPVLNEEAELRYRAYQEELSRHGLVCDPDLVVVGDFQHASGAEAVRLLLEERGTVPDALLAANDYMALGALVALRQRGVKVPEEVGVFGFDDVDDARFAGVPLSTVRQPLFEQGRAALDSVLQELRGRDVKPNLMLETSVVVRQSCGTSDIEQRQPFSSPSEQSLAAALEEHRERLNEDMDRAVQCSSGGYENAASAPLAAAFAADLAEQAPQAFLPSLRRVLTEQTALEAKVSAWQAALSVLREFALPHVQSSTRALMGAETLLHAARSIISDAAEYAEAQKRLRQARQLQALRRIGEALSTAMTETEVMAVTKERLTNVGIPSAFVILYHGANTTQGRLALVDLPSGSLLPRDGERRSALLTTAHVLSERVLPQDRRHSYVVQPLFSKNDRLGVAMFEVGPAQGVVYEFLREQISSALKGASLIKQVIDETARRQAAEKEQLARELELAAHIQTTILPRKFEVPGLEMAATMLPATRVGGDYYDVLPCVGGCWIGIGDVAGHGLRTGLVMLMIQSVVASLCSYNPDATPRALLKVLNDVIYENVRNRLGQDEHATLALIRYTSDGRLAIAGGHEEIIVFRNATKSCELLPTPGPWIGAFEDVEDSNIDLHCRLEDGDLMVLYTDGVTEAMDAKHRQFGLEQLVEEIHNVHSRPVPEVLEHLVACVRRWLASQQDDITLLVARHRRCF